MSTLSDLYRSLFGKDHIQDGTVIDLAEHGRAGGVSTGTSYKSVQVVPLAVQNATNASLTLYGFAKPGTNATLPNWRIMAEDINGNVLFADGDDEFDNTFVDFNSKTFI